MCCCACLPRFCVASHVLCSVMYIGVGAVQLVAGIFFLISLPVFKVGSNVWTGVWNVVVGVGGAVFSSVGDLSPSKHRILLYLTITVLVLNLINLVVLELGEWRILMPDKVKATLQNHNLQTLVLYARMTTSISSALAVVIAFVDAQFMFCWLEHSLRPRHSPLDHKETVSDIEYIIPRAKSGSMGKNNMYNQYNQAAAQSWVFDSDTVGSTHSTHAPTHARANSEHLLPPHRESSPYGKLHHYTNSSKTVVLRRKSNPSSHKLIAHGNGDDDHRDPTKDQIMNGVLNKSKDVTAASNSSRLQPVVLVEGISNDERHLQFMTSFSRTPSPVHPRSESSSPCSNPAPIYECLERLTEPSVYRSRLYTALEATGSDERAERVSPCVSPRPHSVVIASDQQQYASLMVELERTIVAKFPAQDDSRRQSQSNVTQSTQHKQSNSDADFSRQLEAALQLIQDLESPNTVETPSDAPQLSFHQASEMASTSANNNNNNNISQSHNDRAQRLLDNKSIEDRSSDDENTWSSSSHESPHKPLYGKVKGQLSRAAGQKSDLKRKHTTVIRIRDGTERTDESGVPRIDKRGVKDVETYRDPLENRLSSFQPREIGRSTSFSNNSGAGHENRAEKLNEIRFTSFSNNSEAGHENRVRIEEKRVKDDKNTYSSTNSQGFRPISSFQPRDLGRSTSFGTNSEATSKKRVSGVGKSLVKDGETREDSMENRLYSLQAEELGHSNSFSNNSRVIHENREPKIDGNHVKDLETQGDTKGNGLSSSQTKELGRSTSFSDNGRVINESRVPKFDGNHVQHEETFIDSLESRLSSSQLEVVAQSVNNNNLCNDSGVILDYNSEGSENSGKEVVVVVNNTNGAIGNGGVNGGLKECAVIREEVEEDGVAANGGLKNGNLINGAIQNGGVQNGGVQNGGVQNGGVQNGGIQNGGVQNGGVQNGGIQNGGVQNGALVSSSSSSASRSNSLKRSLSSVAKWRMFPKKRAARFVLTPELENTILKSESLLHLTDVELVARYDHNKSIQRKIEEKAWQKIIGASSTDSTC